MYEYSDVTTSVYGSNHFAFPTLPELKGSDIISNQCGSFLQDKWLTRDHGSTVVKVLYYKSEGRWFNPQLASVDFSLI